MQRIASQTIRRVNLFCLSLLPSLALAGDPTPEDFLAAKPLVLEIRYCECQAIATDSSPSALLPGFLKESSLLRVGVANKDEGFASSGELAIGYKINPVKGSSDQYRFHYAGQYANKDGSSRGIGELLLVQGQWVSLFGSQNDGETGSQSTDVAVRLAKLNGS